MSSSQGTGVASGPVPPRTPTQLFVGGSRLDAADGATLRRHLADRRAAPRDARGGNVWTQQAHRLAARLRAGAICINGPGVPAARLPWGGLETSGIGRGLGWAGSEGATEEKTVTVRLRPARRA